MPVFAVLSTVGMSMSLHLINFPGGTWLPKAFLPPAPLGPSPSLHTPPPLAVLTHSRL